MNNAGNLQKFQELIYAIKVFVFYYIESFSPSLHLYLSLPLSLVFFIKFSCAIESLMNELRRTCCNGKKFMFLKVEGLVIKLNKRLSICPVDFLFVSGTK